MNVQPSRSAGSALTAGLCLIAGLAVAAAGVSSVWRPDPPTTSPVGGLATSVSALELLVRLGLDPESLAAAGVLPSQIPALTGAARSFVATDGARLRESDNAVLAARSQLGALSKAIAAGKATPAQSSTLASLKVQFASAQTGQRELVAQARIAVEGALSPQQAATLEIIRSNRGLGLPVEFATAPRGPAEALRLRLALQPHGPLPLDAAEGLAMTGIASAEALSAVRGEPATIQAARDIETNRAALEAALRTELLQQ